MATEQLGSEMLEPHIKAPINPRPQLPQMPQRSTHTNTQFSPSQTRIEQTMVMPQAQLIPLVSASSQSFELTQVVCFNAVLVFALFYHFTTKMRISFFFFCVAFTLQSCI